MESLPRTTDRKSDTLWVCAKGKDGTRPCDGDLYRIATLER
jgi:hypothetical protein